MNKQNYIDFVKSKMAISSEFGFDIDESKLTQSLRPHVKDSVKWAIKGGCRAIFSSFGMMKTVTQLEILRQIISEKGGKGLIVCPKRVISEFVEQANKHIGIKVCVVKTKADCVNSDEDILITNYERVRDGDIDPSDFIATSLDEASVLRSFGSKTFQEFLPKFANVPFRFVATATPSPNRYKELIHYAGYLGVMDTGQALTRFFKRDSTKANNLTLYPHKEEEFWIWVSTWALYLTKPSDLGYSDEGYELPELIVKEEVIQSYTDDVIVDEDGQTKLMRESAVGLKEAAHERRNSIDDKVAKVAEIISREENKDDNFIVWHYLEDERRALCSAIEGCRAVYGSQDDEESDEIVDDFKNGRLKYLAAKPEMLGEGINFQYHCHKAIMFVDYKFNDAFQAIHRIYRFMQTHPVTVYIVYTEVEQEIFKTFMEKWRMHNEMQAKMSNIVRANGLMDINAGDKLLRWMFAKREERSGSLWTAINNDCVLETMNMPDDSVDEIITSIPFSNHYEYTPTYNDFGHNVDNDRFFDQMSYLTTELLRILRPGRVACIHVKDRVLFGNATGTGMPTIDPFSEMTVFHFLKHGFQYMGRITVDTDVVRENNQTYRLGYTEMCKDGTKMGIGCPEYVLLFRKLPTDTSNAYADIPVTKDRTEYSLSRWQIDAHASWKSSGNRMLTPQEIERMGVDSLRFHFRKYQKENVYNFEDHVAFAEELDMYGKLPRTFMAIDPVSKKDWIWDDVVRMRTLNTRQSQKNRQNHICPLQLDIIERLIERYSNKGDLIFDPFGGIQSTSYCAIKKGRRGLSTELNYDYWRDGLTYLCEAENDVLAPTLFDVIDEELKEAI